MERVLDYIEQFAPEVKELVARLCREGAPTVDGQTVTLARDTVHPDAGKLASALATIRSFPEPGGAAEGPVSVILCGGRGTRMRSRDRPPSWSMRLSVQRCHRSLDAVGSQLFRSREDSRSVVE